MKHRWEYNAERHSFTCANADCKAEVTADFLDVQDCGAVLIQLTHDRRRHKFTAVAMHTPEEGAASQGVGESPGEAVDQIAHHLRRRMGVFPVH